MAGCEFKQEQPVQMENRPQDRPEKMGRRMR
jgi:hypothetical protein